MNLTEQDIRDLQTVRQLDIDVLTHTCVWSKDDERELNAARRLFARKLVNLEDSSRGPMVTRTYRGTVAIRKWLEIPIETKGSTNANG